MRYKENSKIDWTNKEEVNKYQKEMYNKKRQGKKRNHIWSKDDRNRLIRLFPKATKEELLKEFPNMNWEGLRGYARGRLNLRRRVSAKLWNDKDLEFLKNNYENGNKQEIIKNSSNRKWYNIMTKAESLGLKRKLSASIMIKDFSHLTEAQKGYIAGLIDGEGSITKMTCAKYSEVYEITITNTFIEVLNWVRNLLNSGKVYKDGIKPRKEWYKQAYKFRLFKSGEVMGLLKIIIPYMIIKKEKGIYALNSNYNSINRFRSFCKKDGQSKRV